MEKTYRTVAGPGEEEVTINKSRFIGHTMPVESEYKALQFIQSIKERHRTATHNVYAYTLGEAGQIQRFSDDGEPSGTAGIPVLEVIKKERLCNTAVVVTRYFGGVKLGGGGLVRAYSKSAKLALDRGIIVEMVIFEDITIKTSYNSYGRIENYLRDRGIVPEEVSFEENVKVRVFIQVDESEKFNSDIREMTSGNSEITINGEIFLPVRDGFRFIPVRGI